MPEIGWKFQVVARAKSEDLVANFNIDIAGQNEKAFFAAMAHFASDAGASRKLDGEHLHVMRLIRTAEKGKAVTSIFGGQVTYFAIPDPHEMDVAVIDIFPEQKGNGSSQRLSKAHERRNRQRLLASFKAGKMPLTETGYFRQLVESQLPLLTHAARIGARFSAGLAFSDFRCRCSSHFFPLRNHPSA